MAPAKTVGRFAFAYRVERSLQGELQSLLSLRDRCCEPGDAIEAVKEQIAVRRLLLARFQEVRERIMHARFAGLKITQPHDRRRQPRSGRSR